MKKLEESKGITLIALVITIIVLLILAGITLALVSGENGILKRATNTVEVNEKATAEEQANLLLADLAVQFYEKKYVENQEGLATLDEYLKEELKEEKTTDLGEYTVKIEEGQVLVSQNGKPISSGSIVNGKVEWTGQSDQDNTNPPAKIPKGLTVGSTVSYAPSGTYHWQAEYALSDQIPGTDDVTLNSAEGQSFHINSWKVLSIDEATGKVQMVPSQVTSGTVFLQGPQGYNNAVKLLNDACSSLYGNASKKITARSIQIEDIEKVMDEKKMNEAKTNYECGKQSWRPYTQKYSHYPFIYGREKLAIIDGTTRQDGLGMSEQSELIARAETENGKTATGGKLQAESNIYPYYTAYYIKSGDATGSLSEVLREPYRSVLLPGDVGTREYWIATRYILRGSESCCFEVAMVGGNSLYGTSMLYSWGIVNALTTASIFPVVSLNSGVISGDGAGNFVVE